MRRSLKRSDFTRYVNLMRFLSDYIHYFVQIPLKLSLTLNGTFFLTIGWTLLFKTNYFL